MRESVKGAKEAKEERNRNEGAGAVMDAALETMPGRRQSQEPKESDEARQRQEESQRSLERGGLPLNAAARLQEQAARQGTPRHLFTSDLSANELTLVRQAGYEAVGQVLGSTAYSVST